MADSSDIYIRFLKGAKNVPGECQTDLSESGSPGRDDLTVGFKPTEMFQLDSFSFSMDLDGSEGGDKDKEKAEKQKQKDAAKTAGTPYRALGMQRAITAGLSAPQANQMQAMIEAYDQHRAEKDKQAAMATQTQFSAWRGGDAKVKYPTRISPMSFSRGLDNGSIELLKHCMAKTLFDRISLVKRKSGGGLSAGKIYLRLDFLDCIITNISWSNAEPVKESVQFISRTIVVSYKPQLPNGRLGGVVKRWWSLDPRQNEPNYQ